MMQYKIFMSFYSDDVGGWAHALYAELDRNPNLSVYKFNERERGGIWGDPVKETIEDQLNLADLIIVIIDRNWPERSQSTGHQGENLVRFELERARRLGKKVLAVAIGDPEMEPSSVRGLDWLLRNSWLRIDPREPELGVRRVEEAVGEIFEAPSSSTKPPPRRPPERDGPIITRNASFVNGQREVGIRYGRNKTVMFRLEHRATQGGNPMLRLPGEGENWIRNLPQRKPKRAQGLSCSGVALSLVDRMKRVGSARAVRRDIWLVASASEGTIAYGGGRMTVEQVRSVIDIPALAPEVEAYVYLEFVDGLLQRPMIVFLSRHEITRNGCSV